MTTVHKNVADHLGAMVGNGIYTVEMIENEFGRYGFTYDRARDLLIYRRGTEEFQAKLGARAPEQAREDVARDMNERGTHGFVDTRADAPLFDALALSQAIYLLLTGEAPPSLSYTNRALGFRADVKAITKYLRRN